MGIKPQLQEVTEELRVIAEKRAEIIEIQMRILDEGRGFDAWEPYFYEYKVHQHRAEELQPEHDRLEDLFDDNQRELNRWCAEDENLRAREEAFQELHPDRRRLPTME